MDDNATYSSRQVTNWSEAKEIFTSLGRYCIFRGQSKSDWPIASLLEREILNRLRAILPPPDILRLEQVLLRSFRQGAHLYQNRGALPDNTLSWWAEMQHYGMATRLVDFTYSPYVASFFAFEPDSSRDRAIWALDERYIVPAGMKILSEEFKWVFKGKHQYDSAYWEDVEFVEAFIVRAHEMSLRTVHFVTPDRLNERMVTQHGIFVMPSTIDVPFMQNLTELLGTSFSKGVIKIILPEAVRLEALRDLDLMNINRASLFPGLEGYARAELEEVQWTIDAMLSGLIDRQHGIRKVLGLPD